MQKPKPVYPSFTQVLLETPQFHASWAGRRLKSQLRETFERYKRLAAMKADPLAWSLSTIDRRNDVPSQMNENNTPVDQLNNAGHAIAGDVRLAPQDDTSSIISSLDLNADTHESTIMRLVAILKIVFPFHEKDFDKAIKDSVGKEKKIY